jgi:tetratricopeptide (TPR) repeat protein
MMRAPAAPGSRRPRVPPALTRGGERFEGLAILGEFDDDLGLLLWQTVRNVLLWTRTPPDERAGVFAGAAADERLEELARLKPDPELQGPLSVVAALLREPERVDVPRLVNACRRVALWAEERGALATALDFAQAAALAAADSPALAFQVGRLARRRAEYDRAESWYTRAIIQGRQAGDWRSYALAFSGLGNLFLQKGNLPLARKANVRSLRAARRHRLDHVAAMAYQALFGVEVETGGERADEYADKALQAYGPSHPNVPRLAYDVAYQWAVQGRFSRALPVATALLPHFEPTSERVLVLGLVARAAGGTGERAAFGHAAEVLLDLTADPSTADTAAAGLLGLVHGATSLGEWEMAETALDRALQVAADRREGKLMMTAEALRDAIRLRRSTQDAPAPEAQEWHGLASDFVDALQAASLAGAAG